MSAVSVALQQLVAPYVEVTLKDGSVHSGIIVEVTQDTLILAKYNRDGEYDITNISSVQHSIDCKCNECMLRLARIHKSR